MLERRDVGRFETGIIVRMSARIEGEMQYHVFCASQHLPSHSVVLQEVSRSTKGCSPSLFYPQVLITSCRLHCADTKNYEPT